MIKNLKLQKKLIFTLLECRNKNLSSIFNMNLHLNSSIINQNNDLIQTNKYLYSDQKGPNKYSNTNTSSYKTSSNNYKKPFQKPKPKQKFNPIRPSAKQLHDRQKQQSHQRSITDPQLFIEHINEKNKIQDAIKLLKRIVNNRNIKKKEFEQNVWKKYSYYIFLIGENQQKIWNGNKVKQNQNNQTENQYQSGNQKTQLVRRQKIQIQRGQCNNNQKDNLLVDNHQIAKQIKSKKLRIQFLDVSTQVHQKFKGQLTSQNITKTFNKFADHYLQKQQWSKLNVHQKVTILQSLSRYNPKKGSAIFLKHRQNLLSPKQIQHFQQQSPDQLTQTIIKLLLTMNKLQINDTKVFEHCIQILYNQIDYMSLLKLEEITFILGKSHKFVNKDFLLKLRNRFYQLINRFKETETLTLLHIVSSLTMIEKNLRIGEIYFQPLDTVYQRIYPYFNSLNMQNFKSKYLTILSSSLRRCQYFDQPIIKSILSQCLHRQVLQFLNQQQSISQQRQLNQFKSISLHNLSQVFFMLASFNYRDPQFVSYYIRLLNMIQSKPSDIQKYISTKIFDRVLWSICVLCDQRQIKSLLPLMEYFYKKVRNVQHHEATNYYYCYLLLKRKYLLSQIRFQNDKIQQYLSGPKHEIRVSQTQKQIYKLIVQMGIPCILQYNLNNIVCDIYIPKYGQIQHIIIQVNGYHHFARNTKRLNGSTILKQKIIENQGYSCFYISLDEWLIAEDKAEFIMEFMNEIIKRKYEQKIKKRRLEEGVSNMERIQKRGRRVIQFKRRNRSQQQEDNQLDDYSKNNKQPLRISNDNNRHQDNKQKN